MKRSISLSLTFVGSIIGAGFASGREISLYFGDCSIFVPLISGALITSLCYLFLSIGSVTDGNPLLLWGKAKPIAYFVVLFSNLITIFAMIAGGESAILALFGIHGGGVITGIIALVIVLFGVEKMKLSNVIIVPIIVVLVLYLLLRNGRYVTLTSFDVIPAFGYSTMNILGCGYLMATLSGKTTKRERIVTSIISGVVTTLLIVAVYFIIQNTKYADMPLMTTAKNLGLEKIGYTVLYLSILTTITGSLSVAGNNKPIPMVVIISLSFCVAVIGFRTIVDKFYPVASMLGVGVAMVYVVLFLNKKRRMNRLLV